MQLNSNDVSRFWEKVCKTENCWEWRGTKSQKGYGIFYLQGKKKRAHQISYALLVGPIPDGLQLDHLCRNPKCVNPAHLEPVTSKENTIRGYQHRSSLGQRRRKEVCKFGHPKSGDNLYISPNGQYGCRTCLRAASRRNFNPDSARSSNEKHRKKVRIQKLLAKLESLGYHCTCSGRDNA